MIEENINTTLTEFAGLAALVGDKIFHGEVEQGVVLPYVSFFIFSDSPVQTLAGSIDTTDSQIQVDVYAGTVLEARDVMVQVRAAMNAATLFKSRHGARRGPARAEPGYQHGQLEFSVWHD